MKTIKALVNRVFAASDIMKIKALQKYELPVIMRY